MKKRNIIILFMCFLLTSCLLNNRKEVAMESFPINTQLLAERIPLKEILFPQYLLAKNDYLFIAGDKKDTMLYQYLIPQFHYKCKMGMKGQGENNFQLFPMFAKSQSADIYIWEYTPLTIKHFSLKADGKLILKDKYTLAAYESFNQMHIVRDSILIYSAIPSEFAIKKVSLDTGELIDKIPIETDNHDESFFYSNRGYVAANDSFIVYPYVYKKQINIYSIDDLTLCKSIIGNYEFKGIKIGDFENNRTYYLNVVAGKKYFYALCKGEQDNVFMEIFDYKGHSIAQYSFDIIPNIFEIDEERRYIYGYNYELEDYFLKYKF